MSVYGPNACLHGGADGDLSAYAKTHHVDVQDGLRVLKTGDTMSGNLQLMSDPNDPQDAATKAYVDRMVALARVKPLITVWAEAIGSIDNDNYEWSFGSGSRRVARSGHKHGYTMMAAGKVIRMGLSASTNARAPSTIRVNLVVNGVEDKRYKALKPPDRHAGTSTFGTPLSVDEGDVLNFRSASSNPFVVSAIVSLLIELDR